MFVHGCNCMLIIVCIFVYAFMHLCMHVIVYVHGSMCVYLNGIDCLTFYQPCIMVTTINVKSVSENMRSPGEQQLPTI